MARLARAEVIDPNEVAVAHVINRTVRRCFLMGDDESLLACMAYVDLNPIRAAIAETIQASDFTSAQRRLEAEQQIDSDTAEAVSNEIPSVRRDAFLAKLTINVSQDPVGADPSDSPHRCSNKGVLELDALAYFELLDWSSRQNVSGKGGTTPQDTPPILERLGLDRRRWQALMDQFEAAFSHLAGRCDRIDGIRSHLTQRRFRVRPLGRKLLPSPS